MRTLEDIGHSGRGLGKREDNMRTEDNTQHDSQPFVWFARCLESFHAVLMRSETVPLTHSVSPKGRLAHEMRALIASQHHS